jgi:hypothetical protein
MGSDLNFRESSEVFRISRISSQPAFQLHRSDNTDAIFLGDLAFLGYSDAVTPAEVTYAIIRGVLSDSASGAEDGALRFVTKNAGADVIQVVAGGVGSGVNIGDAPTGGLLGTGSVNAQDTYYINGSNLAEREALTYSTSMTPNQRNGHAHSILVTDNVAMAINLPTNSVDGAVITFLIRNGSGGAMGAITWNAGYRLAGAFTNPATGFRRSIQFLSTGDGLYHELSRGAADTTA